VSDTHHAARRRAIRVPRGLRTIEGAIGALIVLLVAGLAVIGPALAPHPDRQVVGAPLQGPSSQAVLGTDILGRDVLSRVLSGGLSLLVVALAATALA
jgi:peptide/nickel transport system permease protein